ncbi:glycosyl hydrolase family 28 protein [Paenibacillus xylanexedens]|uniref:glycosyl hydrolase family 28 protein n=1 Tax=Paenibacillus xylanexedens TaxID=528191 RepID=UPI0011A0DE01|nr:glycosyl hydrolase family 28 protein [Paenibacillus xylanexedens]
MQTVNTHLVIYPDPTGAVVNPDFTVSVRKPHGEWQPLFSYNVKVDMHDVRNASMVTFDCSGPVELEIVKNEGSVQAAIIRPISTGLSCEWGANRMLLHLDGPQQLSLEVNGDRFHNLHIFANALEQDVPQVSDDGVLPIEPGLHNMADILGNLADMSLAVRSKVIYFQPGLHHFDTSRLEVPSNTMIYIAGGAVIYGGFICSRVEDVVIRGRGILYLSDFEKTTFYRGVEISYARNISIEGITIIDPPHYTVLIGQSESIDICNIKTFSTRGWSDGIDMMACSDVNIDSVFLRTSDDCIAIYASRDEYRGDTRRVRVTRSILWADVAHPANIGTHGNYEGDGDVIEDIIFSDIDILEHHEPQPDYWGCLAINAGDNNTVQNVVYENIRIEPFELGELFNVRVLQNPKYNPAPGKQIRDILFKNITYNGSCLNPSHIEGYDEARKVENVRFENVTVNGEHFSMERDVILGPHTNEVEVKPT